MVGPIEILPPLPVQSAGASRAAALDPAASADAMTGRRGGATPRPAPIDVVIDIDAAGNPQPSSTQKATSTGAADFGRPHHGRRRALPYMPPEGRRSPYATAATGMADKPSQRQAGTLAYRSADGLVADYAHRGTFFDLSV